METNEHEARKAYPNSADVVSPLRFGFYFA